MNGPFINKIEYTPFTGSPRLDFARETARQVLPAMGDPALPVDPEAALTGLGSADGNAAGDGGNVTCLPYTVARKLFHTVDPLHLRQRGLDARTVYDAASGAYIVVWDDEKGTPGRRRFTLAHECGHIMLGHFTEPGAADIQNRDALNENDRKRRAALEKEADVFAAELLCPEVLLREILPDCGAAVIAAVFGVSMQCAEARLREAEFRKTVFGGNAAENGTGEHLSGSERAVLHLFRDALEQAEIPAPACGKCGTVILKPGQRYCAGCGTLLEKTERKLSGHLPPRLPAGRTGGPSGNAAYCLRCGSTDTFHPGQTECGECGTPLQNRCLRCGKEWPDGYAFCPDCGMECALRSAVEVNEKRTAELERDFPPNDVFLPCPRLRYARAEALRRGKTELAASLRTARLMVNEDNGLLLICNSLRDRRRALRYSGDLLDILDEFAPRHPCIGIYAAAADAPEAERAEPGDFDGNKQAAPAETARRTRKRKPGTGTRAPEDRTETGKRSAGDDAEREMYDPGEQDEINAILSGKDRRG